LRKGDVLGLALAFWAGLTFLTYTLASEKMPWLLVNIILPFILLSGKYLGELVEHISWHRMVRQGQILLLATTPLGIVVGVYLVRNYVDIQASFSVREWGILAVMVLTLIVSAYLVRLAHPPRGMALVGLGTAALLLVFGAWAAFRASYTYDDSRPEFLIYAQGSADLKKIYRRLEQRVFQAPTHNVPVLVDYEMWYPFQWYVRHQEQNGDLRFSCFKDNNNVEGATPGCGPVHNETNASALLLVAPHAHRDDAVLTGYQKEGPYRNLIWFPESYRRPDENRQAEGLDKELANDFAFFKAAATSRDVWRRALDYIILRELERDWYSSEYYIYMP
jgi:predicted membrane-bound mannosyltransferase